MPSTASLYEFQAALCRADDLAAEVRIGEHQDRDRQQPADDQRVVRLQAFDPDRQRDGRASWFPIRGDVRISCADVGSGI